MQKYSKTLNVCKIVKNIDSKSAGIWKIHANKKSIWITLENGYNFYGMKKFLCLLLKRCRGTNTLWHFNNSYTNHARAKSNETLRAQKKDGKRIFVKWTCLPLLPLFDLSPTRRGSLSKQLNKIIMIRPRLISSGRIPVVVAASAVVSQASE